MEFEVLFEDGTKKWMTYSKDLYDSIPFEEYCNSQPQLVPLQFPVLQAQNYIGAMNKKVIEIAKASRPSVVETNDDSIPF